MAKWLKNLSSRKRKKAKETSYRVACSVETSPLSDNGTLVPEHSSLKRSLNYPDTVENDRGDDPLRSTPVLRRRVGRSSQADRVQFRQAAITGDRESVANDGQLAPFFSFSCPVCPSSSPSYRDYRDHRHE